MDEVSSQLNSPPQTFVRRCQSTPGFEQDQTQDSILVAVECRPFCEARSEIEPSRENVPADDAAPLFDIAEFDRDARSQHAPSAMSTPGPTIRLRCERAWEDFWKSAECVRI